MRSTSLLLRSNMSERTTVNFATWIGFTATRRMRESMMYMVGGDAFSQALTNPLLANGICCEDCFSDVGVEEIEATSTFADIVRRNTQSTGGKVSFDI